eukprot:scaffold57063_cov19-Tisochrysis_lutea.AAC.1
MHLSLHTCKQSIHSCIPKCAWTCPQTQITDKLPQRALSLFKRKFTYVRPRSESIPSKKESSKACQMPDEFSWLLAPLNQSVTATI